MAKQSKAQQIQFFEYCLLPEYEADTSQIDLRAEVDATLTTGENWENLDKKYGISGLNHNRQDYQEMSWNHLANKVLDETGYKPETEELKELGNEGLLNPPQKDQIVSRFAD
ncbi:MAG: hypothetical protein R6V35_00755 [Candidatus Nanohaloarchaea archaeon]